MANLEQVEALKQGPSAWRDYRRLHGGVPIDLSGAELDGLRVGWNKDHELDFGASDAFIRNEIIPYEIPLDLTGADLTGAKLRNSELVGADLKEAKLHGTRLEGAEISFANLQGSDLTGIKAERAVFAQSDLSGSNLRNAYLYMANFYRANLSGACLESACLMRGQLAGVCMTRASLTGIDLSDADLTSAILSETKILNAKFRGTRLPQASLVDSEVMGIDACGADLRWANLSNAKIVDSDLSDVALNRAILEGLSLERCRINGMSAWSLEGDPKHISDLVITPKDVPPIVVEDPRTAQLLHELLDNQAFKYVLEGFTARVVLILGRFTRKDVLDSLRRELRNHNLVSVLFDFDRPESKDTTGTVETLARLSRFIMADLTDPSCIPHELAMIAPQLRTTPIVLLRLAETGGYSMVEDLSRAYKWVLPVREYTDPDTLIERIEDLVIAPAEESLAGLRR